MGCHNVPGIVSSQLKAKCSYFRNVLVTNASERRIIACGSAEVAVAGRPITKAANAAEAAARIVAEIEEALAQKQN